MRKRWLGVLVVAGAVLVAAPGVGVAKKNPYPLDNVLRVNDVQVLGTHNSYHVRPERTMAPDDASNYAHPPLDQQLESGIRSVEIDVQNGPGFPVYHSIIVDQSSNCPTLAACLGTVAQWSSANPGHVPITIFVELKELPTNANPTLQQVIDDFVLQHELAPWDAATLDRLDAVVRARVRQAADHSRPGPAQARHAARRDHVVGLADPRQDAGPGHGDPQFGEVARHLPGREAVAAGPADVRDRDERRRRRRPRSSRWRSPTPRGSGSSCART